MILYLYILSQKTNTKDISFLAPIEVVSSFGTIETKSGKMVSKKAGTIRFKNFC